MPDPRNIWRWTKRELIELIQEMGERQVAEHGTYPGQRKGGDARFYEDAFARARRGAEAGLYALGTGTEIPYEAALLDNLRRHWADRLVLERILSLPALEARQAFVEWQMSMGQLPQVAPTRGEVESGGAEVESPEDWWKPDRARERVRRRR